MIFCKVVEESFIRSLSLSWSYDGLLNQTAPRSKESSIKEFKIKIKKKIKMIYIYPEEYDKNANFWCFI